MKQSKLLIPALFLLAFSMGRVTAQENGKPDWRKLHYLSEEEMNSTQRNTLFNETNPPDGDYVRFPAEFEPMQAVTIRYPLGIPTSLVKQLSERTKVYVIVSSNQQNNARNTFQNAGCNMSNIAYYNMTTDSYWVRDYGPWYIFNGMEPAIVDNVYNRPRQNDNMVPIYMGQKLGLSVYGMNLTHTGGNMMEDGRGVGVSDDLILNENSNNETNVRNKMRDYLGIDPYHITIDPQGDYIAHVDCWGKFLAPDKILIAQLPQSNSRYEEYEEVAEFFANTNCCWGYPYKVYRVYEPGGNTLAPYTNSLIVNNTVFVPLGTNTTYNNNALAVYQTAMPGYEIIGVSNSSGSTAWQNTDALHCRTRGVMDFDMLFVDHRDVIYGTQAMQDSIAVTSKFIAYSGEDLIQDSLLVYYSIDGGSYQAAHMTATGNPNEYVGYIKGYTYSSTIDYYVYGADESGHRYSQPSYGALEPHHFDIEEGPAEIEQTITLNAGWTWWSTYLDITLENLETALATALPEGQITIKSQFGGNVSYSNGQWRGSFSLNVAQMYEIWVSSDCTITLSGAVVDPAEHPVSINNGSSWIGFPMSESMGLTEAFANFTPTNGDIIKNQNTSATYYSGTWYGALKNLQPGVGYIYKSMADTNKTLVFPHTRK